MSRVVLCCVAALLAQAPPGARGDEAEDKAAKFVEKLGGRVVRDGKKPGKPVYAVDLDRQPVTDADVRQFYEENKDRAQGRTFDQLADQIKAFLTSNRQQQARAILVDDLKKKAGGTRILLEPPRIAVEISNDDPYVGPTTAPVTIVEFSDYQ